MIDAGYEVIDSIDLTSKVFQGLSDFVSDFHDATILDFYTCPSDQAFVVVVSDLILLNEEEWIISKFLCLEFRIYEVRIYPGTVEFERLSEECLTSISINAKGSQLCFESVGAKAFVDFERGVVLPRWVVQSSE
ncbi:MAG: hypothetical protein AAGC81_19770 [Pseudomonadota bacterium]